MTKREIEAVGDVLETLSDWLLGVIERNPNKVAALAHNELLARRIKNESRTS